MKLQTNNFLLTSAKMLLLTTALSFSLISCSDDDDDNDNMPSQTVLDIAVANPDFDILAAAATRAGLTGVLGGSTQLTVFAPTDEAFIAHLDADNEAAAIAAVTAMDAEDVADLLTFHVISGSEIEAGDLSAGTQTVTTARTGVNNKAYVTKTGANVTINNARVVEADVDASNGVIHVIDAVLTPPTGNVIQVATSPAYAESFNILAAALTKADLITTLQGNGPFTVFAPTDDAFLALLRSATFTNDPELTEEEAIEAVMALDASSTPLTLDQFKEVLLYHVVSGTKYSINLTNGVLPTLKGAAPNTVTVAVGTSVTVDGSASDPSTVAIANVSATNGVIHAIDKVLVP